MDLRKFFSWWTKNRQLVTIKMFSWEHVSVFNCCNLKTKIKSCFGGFAQAHCVIVTCVWRHANTAGLFSSHTWSSFWFWKKKDPFLSCVLRKYKLNCLTPTTSWSHALHKWAKTFESISLRIKVICSFALLLALNLCRKFCLVKKNRKRQTAALRRH